MDGLTAVCWTCGRPYYVDSGHLCPGPKPVEPAGTSEPGEGELVPAVTLADGTPHPDPWLASRGWLVIGGVYQVPPDGGGDDGEEAAA